MGLKFKIPSEIIDEFNKTGVLAFGEIHGVKENYDFYDEFLNELPFKPNIALEIKNYEKEELDKYIANQEIDSSRLSKDGRLNLDLFKFLKKYKEKNNQIKIFSFDENIKSKDDLSSKNLSRDEEMAINFLNIYEKPIVIISGNLHTEKEIIYYTGQEIIPMCYFLKNKIGDFPVIRVRPVSGNYWNFELKEVNLEIDSPTYEFIKKEPNKYDFFLENVTPVSILKN